MSEDDVDLARMHRDRDAFKARFAGKAPADDDPLLRKSLPVVGDSIGDWKITRQLGSGAFGVVYELEHVHQSGFPSRAAKFLHPSYASNASERARFDKEVRILIGLEDSPSRVKIYDSGFYRTDGGTLPYFVMERLQGTTLAAQPRPATIRRVRDVANQILGGLSELHRAGVIHQDIKPANLFLAKSGDTRERLTLLDFGLAEIVTPVNINAYVSGTPVYMAPEQFLGSVPNARADLYSVCVVLYELITGRLPIPLDRPFTRENLKADFDDYARKVREVPPAPIDREGVPDALVRALMLGLEKDPSNRPDSAARLLDLITRGRDLVHVDARERHPWLAERVRLHGCGIDPRPTLAAGPWPHPSAPQHMTSISIPPASRCCWCRSNATASWAMLRGSRRRSTPPAS